MVRFRYTSWDGKQPTRLDPDELFDRLAGYLSETDDIGEALDRLMRSGFEAGEFEAVGLDELLERLSAAVRDLYERFNLDRAFDDHRRRIDELREHEEEAVEGLSDVADREKRSRYLERLPRDVAEALDRLSHYDFVDRDARGDHDNLSEDLDDVRRLSDFIRRYGGLFTGSESLDFEEALEVMERIEALKSLEEQLFNRDFDAIDLDEVAELLGADVADAIGDLRDLLMVLTDAGYVANKGGRLVLSPKGARRLGQLALREIHKSLVYDAGGRHETGKRGPAEVDMTASRSYEHGDPMQLDVAATLTRALRRRAELPVRLEPGDFQVFESRHTTRNATVLLLDMSWSMSWEGRFAAAKKVALAMETLMRTRFPRDYFAVVGFYTRAVELTLADLPEVTWNMGDPFTNLQDGLRLGANLLRKQAGRNKNMIVITDGQPTAYFADGRLFCEWPMSLGGLSTRATAETLREVKKVTRAGIRINTFMLDNSPPLRAFVEKMTAINRGRAFYTTPDQLGRFLLVDYVGRRRKVI